MTERREQVWIKLGVMLSRGEDAPWNSWTGSMKSVFIALALRVNEDNKCWPSIPTICEDTGLGRKAIWRATDELEATGALEVTCDLGRPNVYHITAYVAYGTANPTYNAPSDCAAPSTGKVGSPNVPGATGDPTPGYPRDPTLERGRVSARPSVGATGDPLSRTNKQNQLRKEPIKEEADPPPIPSDPATEDNTTSRILVPDDFNGKHLLQVAGVEAFASRRDLKTWQDTAMFVKTIREDIEYWAGERSGYSIIDALFGQVRSNARKAKRANHVARRRSGSRNDGHASYPFGQLWAKPVGEKDDDDQPIRLDEAQAKGLEHVWDGMDDQWSITELKRVGYQDAPKPKPVRRTRGNGRQVRRKRGSVFTSAVEEGLS